MMKQTSPAAKIFSWIFALFWLVVCLLPFTQLISVTFSTADRGIVSTFYPNSLSSGIENIKQALLQTNMSPSTLQTLIYVSVTIVGMLIVSSLAAYELACFKFPGRDVIFMLILSSMMLPMITYIIPLYRFVYNLGWSDTLIGLAIPSIPSAFAVFIIRQFLESMPHELIEAGEIDGAGHISACGIAADGHAAADGDGHTVYAGVGFLFVADIGGGNQMEARQRLGGRSSGGWFLD